MRGGSRAALLLALLTATRVSAQGQPDPAKRTTPSREGKGASAGAGAGTANRGSRRPARPRAGSTDPRKSFVNPHASSRPRPQVTPTRDVPHGSVEVRLNPKGLDALAERDVTLKVTRQSIEEGNATETVTARTNRLGVARFDDLGTETDFLYQVSVSEGAATYSTQSFQFRPGIDAGIRVSLPLYPATASLAELVLLSRALVAFTPQEDHFEVDVRWRFENFSDMSWVPENVTLTLPPDFEALQFQEDERNVRLERSESGPKVAGTVMPGQHDLSFRFHLPTHGKSERTLALPTNLNVGSLRVFLSGSSSMTLSVDDFPKAEETRNRKGQRMLVAGRDFLSEREKAPERIMIRIAGVPTPPVGRSVAVGIAAFIAVLGLFRVVRRRSGLTAARSELSKEDLERATELLLGELVELEKAFRDGGIGRRMYDRTRRQLLDAFARLGAERELRTGPA